MALFGALPDPHTLAQFARRAGISEGRARALYTAHKLPRPDQLDADRRPLWSATTIDAWCQQTGRRPLGERVSWLHRAAPAAEPAPVLLDRIVEHGRGYGALTVHAIVWDTPNGHVIYLTPVYDAQGNGAAPPDWIAEVATGLIQPAFWEQALIVQPITGGLGSDLIIPTVHMNLHQLEAEQTEDAVGDAGGWLRRRKVSQPMETSKVRARFAGMVKVDNVAAVIGAPVPLWIAGTCTREAVQRARAYNSTFTVPDAVTDWPPARDQVQAALDADMPNRFPAGFAALAANGRATYEEVQALQARQRDAGEGWYLVARPAPPELPFTSEVVIIAAQPSEDIDAIALELTELRSVEANLSVNAPEGDAYETAVKLLAWQLRELNPKVAADRIEIYEDTYSGPVIDQWRQTLHPVPDLNAAMKTRRVRRLLSTWDPSSIVEVLRGPRDQHVLVVKNELGTMYFEAEWPYALPGGWNERTIIAADPDSMGAVFALTPAPSGDMNVDPLPLEPGTGPGFGYGYDGGSPYTLYQALIRCVFGTPEAPFTLVASSGREGAARGGSDLWRAIVTTDGPLRLPWPAVQKWARADGVKLGFTDPPRTT
jgi:hypothetical protein